MKITFVVAVISNNILNVHV